MVLIFKIMMLYMYLEFYFKILGNDMIVYHPKKKKKKIAFKYWWNHYKYILLGSGYTLRLSIVSCFEVFITLILIILQNHVLSRPKRFLQR